VSGVGGVLLIQYRYLSEGDLTALVALASSFCSAIAMLGLHRLRHIDARAIVVHFSAVALVFAVAAVFLFGSADQLDTTFDPWTLLALGVIGVTATVGQLCLTKAFALGEPAKVSVVGLMQIVFAMLLSLVVLGNELHLLTVVGIALVMGPTAWVILQRKRNPVVQEAAQALPARDVIAADRPATSPAPPPPPEDGSPRADAAPP
jgi:drug/metabolite transporter (DMT)-like permease